MINISASVVSNTQVVLGVCLMWFEAPELASIAKPGQFVMAKCGEDNLLRRPLSIHQVNDDKTELALLFSEVGKGTQWLSQRQAGDSIDLLGPLGNGFAINPNSHNLLLVAGGIGVAPLLFLADAAIKQGKEVTFLLGIPTAAQAPLEKLLSPDIDLIMTCDDGTACRKGLITDVICEHVWRDQIFACGPSPMYRTMAKMPELKDKPVQISLEVRMGCGFGVCYGCTIKTRQGLKQACQDGPVFNLDDILWDEFVDIEVF